MALVQQAADQTSLEQDHDYYDRKLPAILCPDTWLAKQDLAARRQIALADAPTPQFAPIIFRGRQLNRLELDAVRFLAAQDSQRSVDRPPAGFSNRMHRTADGFAVEEGFLIGKDRGVGDGTKTAQGEITFLCNAGTIHRHQAPEQHRV